MALRTIASIDVGTNSIKLLIANVSSQGRIEPLYEKVTITRLGEGVETSNRLNHNAMERTINCLDVFRKICESYDVEDIIALGTKALRTAANAPEFVIACKNRCGINVRIIDSDEEARLTYLGAITNSKLTTLNSQLIIDIGGGSTELATKRNGKFHLASLDIGAVSLTEKFIYSDPPSHSELRTLADYIATVIAIKLSPLHSQLSTINSKLATHNSQLLIGVGGTVTTLASIYKNLRTVSPEKIHNTTLSLKHIKEIYARLSALPLARRRKVSGLEAKRADIVVAGTLILMKMMEYLKQDKITVSTRGVRYGAIVRIR